MQTNKIPKLKEMQYELLLELGYEKMGYLGFPFQSQWNSKHWYEESYEVRLSGSNARSVFCNIKMSRGGKMTIEIHDVKRIFKYLNTLKYGKIN